MTFAATIFIDEKASNADHRPALLAHTPSSQLNVPADQRQNKTSKMMIGNGIPISHSNAPFPIPITTLL
jgi:hypothetical protein